MWGSLVAKNDQAATAVNEPITIDVLANDQYQGRPEMTTFQGLKGRCEVTARNWVVFTPEEDFQGWARCQYEICFDNSEPAGKRAGNKKACSEARIRVRVSPPGGGGGRAGSDPIVRDYVATAAGGQPVAMDVLTNYEDPDGDGLYVGSVADPPNGSVFLEDDIVTYTPADGFIGSDSFLYTVCNSSDRCGE